MKKIVLFIGGVASILIVSLFSYIPGTYGQNTSYGLSLSPQSITAGQAFSILWTAPAGQNLHRDWIGIYRVGASNQTYVTWRYAGTLSGSAPLALTVPGSYEARYLKNNGYATVTATLRFEITTLPAGSYALSVTPTSVATLQTFQARWQTPATSNNTRDWIGIYTQGAPNNRYLTWKYTNGTQTGTLNFTLAHAGNFEARYFKNNGYTTMGEPARFTVTAATPDTSYQLSVNTPIISGNPVIASWVAPSSSNRTRDWIGIYRPGSNNNSYLTWKYTSGQTSGYVSFTFSTPGAYEARYFKNNGYTKVGPTVPFTIQAVGTSSRSATLSWNQNTEADLASYTVYYGTSPRTSACPPGGYTNTQNTGLARTLNLHNLTASQTYYFSITAKDTSGNESCFSNQVSKTIPQ